MLLKNKLTKTIDTVILKDEFDGLKLKELFVRSRNRFLKMIRKNYCSSYILLDRTELKITEKELSDETLKKINYYFLINNSNATIYIVHKIFSREQNK